MAGGGLLMGVGVLALGVSAYAGYSYASTPDVHMEEELHNAGAYVQEYRHTGEEDLFVYNKEVYRVVYPDDALGYAADVLQDAGKANNNSNKEISELEEKVSSVRPEMGKSTNEAVYRPVLEEIGNEMNGIEGKDGFDLGCCIVEGVLGLVGVGVGYAIIKDD
ncbi:hypothetical protein JXB11_00320 [Candidatus Woesearchaeota archaeon]|nr:hypothetical protein [Candidatus Woesearchaeota archaeon]